MKQIQSYVPRTLRRGAGLALTAASVVVVCGCSGYQAFREGKAQLAEGQVEGGVNKLHLAMEQNPSNNEFRRTFFTQREAAINAALRDADQAIELGEFSVAREAVARALRMDAGNVRAAAGAGRIEVAERQWKALDASTTLARDGDLDAAVAKTRQVLSENPNHRQASNLLRRLLRQQADVTGKELGIYPRLRAAYRVPVSLSFTNATLQQVFEALKQASGLNYMIERDVKPDLRITLSVTQKPVEDIVRLILATNQLERRILDDDTLLIYANTPAKVSEYREMVIRTFYLSNAEALKVAANIKTMTKARDVVIDEKLNMVMVRDSSEVIRLVEKIIAAVDLPEPEVMLELEVLEVSVSRLVNMGIRWPDSISATAVGSGGVAGELTLRELRSASQDLVRINTNNPALSAQLRSQKGDANLLANPRVRVRNKQTAKILIGERVPVITTTATANVGTTQSVNYLDVGLKLEIEPTISLDGEVSMKIGLEVSNISQTILLTGGAQAYRLGTRNTATTLRVRDGETNILAGLIQRDERRANTGVPGFNEIPLVSKLFGTSEDSDMSTEIVLLITPRIVRGLDVPGLGQQEFLSGTEASTGSAPIQLGTSSGSGPATASRVNGSPAPAPSSPVMPPQLPPSVQTVPGLYPPQPMPNPPGQPPAAPVFSPPPLVPSSPGSK